MVSVKIRHLVKKPSGYYWQPSKAALALGFRAEGLGKVEAAAVRRAEELNAKLDDERGTYREPALKEKSVSWVVAQYKADQAYTAKAVKTRRGYDQCLAIIEKFCGDFGIEQVTGPAIKVWYRGMFARKKWQANAVLRVLRILLSFAKSEGLVATNTAADVPLMGTKARQHVWEQDEVDDFIAAALDLGMPSMALAVRLAYDVGQREGDLLVAQDSQVKVRSLEVRQSKTKALVLVPLTPDSMRAIKLWGKSPTLIVCEATGKPYSEHLFRKKFAQVRAKAGIRDDLQYRDLRRTAVVHMARGGVEKEAIASVTGHTYKSIAGILETYLPRDSEMAAAGIASLRAYRQKQKVGKRK